MSRIPKIEVTLDLFLHGNGHPQIVPARPDETLRQFLARLDAVPNDEQYVFAGEAEEPIHHPDPKNTGGCCLKLKTSDVIRHIQMK